MASELGVYFSWGNVEGHPEGSGYDFSQEVYDASPGSAISSDLSLVRDAARVNLGAPWRMPRIEEFQELIDNCTSVWTTLNGMNGRLFTSNVNGNTIFFPAAGCYVDASLTGHGTFGRYWSTKYANANYAHDFGFTSSEINTQNPNSRFLGFTVRAVMVPT